MPLNERDAASIWDMVEAIHRIQAFTAGVSEQEYLRNELVQSAVERQLEILGEAARRVSPDVQVAQTDVDWAGMIGLRNVIAHRYDQIRADRIWGMLVVELPHLLAQLEALLPTVEDADGEMGLE